MTNTKPDYKTSAILLGRLASPEFRELMTESHLNLDIRTGFNNYVSTPRTTTLKVDKHIGLIEADNPQTHFNTFNPRKSNDGFGSSMPRPLASNYVKPEDYEKVAIQFDLTPEYLLNFLKKS
jgi:hypothetical protein